MIVDLDLEKHCCTVKREDGDPTFRSSGWTLAESTFLYHVKKALQAQGHDVIKKRMWRDGHLVDDTQQYIRTRAGLDKPGNFAIYNDAYAVYDAGEYFNQRGVVYLDVVTVDGAIVEKEY